MMWHTFETHHEKLHFQLSLFIICWIQHTFFKSQAHLFDLIGIFLCFCRLVLCLLFYLLCLIMYQQSSFSYHHWSILSKYFPTSLIYSVVIGIYLLDEFHNHRVLPISTFFGHAQLSTFISVHMSFIWHESIRSLETLIVILTFLMIFFLYLCWSYSIQ